MVAFDDLGQVVRRNVGGHAHRDARRAVDQQVRNARGQDFRLLLAARRSWAGNRRSPCRCPPAARWRCARAALRCTAWPRADRRRPSRSCPGRRPADSAWRKPAPCGPARRRSAASPCGWYLPMHFADDLGALAGGPVGVQPHLVHAVENAAMHGLQAVADIGQRAADDHAHGVIEIRPPHLVFDVDGDGSLPPPSPPSGIWPPGAAGGGVVGSCGSAKRCSPWGARRMGR